VALASRFSTSGMVCSVDHLASQAGVSVMRTGGNAVDAAVAANAVLAVTSQHMCGLGGDLFALVHEPGAQPHALNASGRSGSGADPEGLRAEGHRSMPAKGDIRSVPVPGCVDGWVALHSRFGRLPLPSVLEPAVHYANDGFPASPLLAFMAPAVAGLRGGSDFAVATEAGAIVRRPGVADALEAVARDGRDGFYRGEFGKGLLELGAGEYTADDLLEVNADWVEPLHVDAWGSRVWTVPPNSQGYLALAGAWIASGLPLPSDAGDPLWAHLLIESARAAAFDRLDVLSEAADGPALLREERLVPRREAISTDRAAELGGDFLDGDTTFLCAVDRDGWGVSLIQSNATGFGAGIAEPSTGIFLHNRGFGFSLEPGHPAEYGPRRRPPHTLSPLLVTNTDGSLEGVLGTMGGDAQPQVLLQLLDRLLRLGEPVGSAISAPRWILQAKNQPHGFDTWEERGAVQVTLEPGCPDAWLAGLAGRGHPVSVAGANFGHAHAIVRHPDGVLEGAADPRSLIGEAAGY
jgi:gamma-glutamyltranspeptidase/glutathione hydrolase